MIDQFPIRYRVIAPDQRGHGDSEKTHGGYDLGSLAADAAGLLDALGLRTTAVVGHSLGSLVAQRLAASRPERVSRLVLIASGPPGAARIAAEGLWETVRNLTDPIEPGFVREFQESSVRKPLPPAFLDRVVAESLKVPARVWRAALAGMRDAEDLSGETAIRAPTLILWGDQDGVFTADDQGALLAQIPGAALKVYPGAGHGVHWERPQEVAADIAEFLNPGRC